MDRIGKNTKDWSGHEARARREISEATWLRENTKSSFRKKKTSFKTVSTTPEKTWEKRIERRDRRWASLSSPVEVKKKCLSCQVIYDPETTEHAC